MFVAAFVLVMCDACHGMMVVMDALHVCHCYMIMPIIISMSRLVRMLFYVPPMIIQHLHLYQKKNHSLKKNYDDELPQSDTDDETEEGEVKYKYTFKELKEIKMVCMRCYVTLYILETYIGHLISFSSHAMFHIMSYSSLLKNHIKKNPKKIHLHPHLRLHILLY